jgi:hypothetical protein
MAAVPIVFALLAAFCNALNVFTQHIASIGDPEHSKGWKFVRYLVANPLWLFGWVALAGAFVFQALALHNGLMSVVQPLLVTELVFALVLRRLWIRQSIRAVTWWSAAVTCVALALFLGVAEPTGTDSTPATSDWLGATIAVVVVTAALCLLALRGSPGRRAALLGSATAVLWALVATFIKAMTDSLTQYGFGGMFMHWPVYALALGGLAAELLDQTTLHVGPLSMSQPFLVVVDPIVSIALSVWVFSEQFSESVPRLAFGSLAFAMMCISVMALARTAPATMDPAGASSGVSSGPSTGLPPGAFGAPAG